MLHSYAHPLAVGHRALEGLFDNPVVVQEKIDGSQISFGMVRYDGLLNKLEMRSRNQVINLDDPGMFALAVSSILPKAQLLREGWTYRGEFLSKPKHNTLVYDRVPAGNIILFDVDRGNQDYLTPDALDVEARRLGLETVPWKMYLPGQWNEAEANVWLDRTSVLGNVKIEGVVVKNYSRFGEDGKALMGKLVSSAFKERHTKDWKIRNPGQNDFIQKLTEELRTEARWRKAIQHLAEEGRLTNSPQDIGPLLGEISKDVHAEIADELREKLFKFFWPKIARGLTVGFPDFYKNYLAEQ